MTLVGYMRVSSDSDRQTTDLQRDALLSAGVDSRHLTNLAAGDTSVGSTPCSTPLGMQYDKPTQRDRQPREMWMRLTLNQIAATIGGHHNGGSGFAEPMN